MIPLSLIVDLFVSLCLSSETSWESEERCTHGVHKRLSESFVHDNHAYHRHLVLQQTRSHTHIHVYPWSLISLISVTKKNRSRDLTVKEQMGDTYEHSFLLPANLLPLTTDTKRLREAVSICKVSLSLWVYCVLCFVRRKNERRDRESSTGYFSPSPWDPLIGCDVREEKQCSHSLLSFTGSTDHIHMYTCPVLTLWLPWKLPARNWWTGSKSGID